MEQELVSTVNELLNDAKQKLNLSSDEQLAKHYKVSAMTITRWRQGKALGKALVTILPIAIERIQSTEATL